MHYFHKLAEKFSKGEIGSFWGKRSNLSILFSLNLFLGGIEICRVVMNEISRYQFFALNTLFYIQKRKFLSWLHQKILKQKKF